MKWHFCAIDDEDDRTLNDTRGLACEFIAWRFVTHLTETEAIEYLCHELPPLKTQQANKVFSSRAAQPQTEQTPLLADDDAEAQPGPSERSPLDLSDDESNDESHDVEEEGSFAEFFAGLNSLEIAAVSNAKKFLSQRAIQRIIDGLWGGDIVFWETLSTRSTKQARLYNKKKSDPFCRLRVPKYLKVFEVVFFAAFLAFYYTVLIQKPALHTTAPEIMLYIWLAAFAYNGVYSDSCFCRRTLMGVCRVCRVPRCRPRSVRNGLLGVVGSGHHRDGDGLLRATSHRARKG